MRNGFADKYVPEVSVSGWQAENQKRQLSVRDREDFRCSRSTAEITIHVRDREDFRCSRSTAEITIHVRGRAGHHTVKKKCRKFEANIPRKGISGPQSQFPH